MPSPVAKSAIAHSHPGSHSRRDTHSRTGRPAPRMAAWRPRPCRPKMAATQHDCGISGSTSASVAPLAPSAETTYWVPGIVASGSMPGTITLPRGMMLCRKPSHEADPLPARPTPGRILLHIRARPRLRLAIPPAVRECRISSRRRSTRRCSRLGPGVNIQRLSDVTVYPASTMSSWRDDGIGVPRRWHPGGCQHHTAPAG